MKQDDILEVKRRHEGALLALNRVVGVGIGEIEGESKSIPCIRVYVERIDEEIKKSIPEALEGFPVIMVEVGEPMLY